MLDQSRQSKGFLSPLIEVTAYRRNVGSYLMPTAETPTDPTLLLFPRARQGHRARSAPVASIPRFGRVSSWLEWRQGIRRPTGPAAARVSIKVQVHLWSLDRSEQRFWTLSPPLAPNHASALHVGSLSIQCLNQTTTQPHHAIFKASLSKTRTARYPMFSYMAP